MDRKDAECVVEKSFLDDCSSQSYNTSECVIHSYRREHFRSARNPFDNNDAKVIKYVVDTVRNRVRVKEKNHRLAPFGEFSFYASRRRL